MKEYTLAEVATHNSRESLFIVIKDEVYEVSKFLAEHPGGEEVLLEFAGKEASEAFEDVGHSLDAKDILKTFHVGTIVEAERLANKVQKKTEEKKLLIVALSGLAMGVGLVVICRFMKSK